MQCLHANDAAQRQGLAMLACRADRAVCTWLQGVKFQAVCKQPAHVCLRCLQSLQLRHDQSPAGPAALLAALHWGQLHCPAPSGALKLTGMLWPGLSVTVNLTQKLKSALRSFLCAKLCQHSRPGQCTAVKLRQQSTHGRQPAHFLARKLTQQLRHRQHPDGSEDWRWQLILQQWSQRL